MVFPSTSLYINLFLIFVVLLLPLETYTDLVSKIIGGAPTPWSEYPFMASVAIRVEQNKMRMCGGSIIHSRWILTAAHCLIDVRSNDVLVFVGSTKYAGGKRHTARSLKIHSGYNGEDNDIALIGLSSPISFGEGQKLLLNTKPVPIGTTATLIGWGVSNPELVNAITPLHSVKLRVAKCQRTLLSGVSLIDALFGDSLLKPNINNINNENDDNNYDSSSSTVICTSTMGGQGACVGDSGGPLIVGRRQIGVVSRGTPCATGSPDIYTKVQAYVGWIEE